MSVSKEKIKNIVLIFFITAFVILTFSAMIIGCNTTSSNVKIDPYLHLTGESIATACTEPSAIYPITRMGFPMEAMVVRHEKCLGINDMLMVVWPGELSETKLTGAKLLLLMFLDYQNLSNPETNLEAKHVKNLVLDEGETHMSIYSLETSLITSK